MKLSGNTERNAHFFLLEIVMTKHKIVNQSSLKANSHHEQPNVDRIIGYVCCQLI